MGVVEAVELHVGPAPQIPVLAAYEGGETGLAQGLRAFVGFNPAKIEVHISQDAEGFLGDAIALGLQRQEPFFLFRQDMGLEAQELAQEDLVIREAGVLKTGFHEGFGQGLDGGHQPGPGGLPRGGGADIAVQAPPGGAVALVLGGPQVGVVGQALVQDGIGLVEAEEGAEVLLGVGEALPGFFNAFLQADKLLEPLFPCLVRTEEGREIPAIFRPHLTSGGNFIIHDVSFSLISSTAVSFIVLFEGSYRQTREV